MMIESFNNFESEQQRVNQQNIPFCFWCTNSFHLAAGT